MAEIIQEEKGKGRKGKGKKIPPHIDMTPMVDLMCLLITFFMLTTAFSRAKIMEIILPEKVTDPSKQDAPRISKSRTLNILLGPDNKIYVYPGSVDPEALAAKPPVLPPLTPTDFSPEGIRKILLERNKALFRKINDFNSQVLSGKIPISQDSAKVVVGKLKSDDDTGPIVLIKAYKKANYGNFVDILDEMNICGIARYTFMPIAWYEEKMVETAAGITSTPAPGSSK
ncbi:MAG: biopolymer transporter ExbD [Bacteroidota bacterium]|nr:biopolymer transporter ExbD [Bacteroidota bacterium]